MKVQSKNKTDKVDIQMTPMIDIVFQLLVFFIFTLKIVGQEGDFAIKMPLAAPRAGLPDESLPPMKVKMKAGPGGSLAQISLNDNNFGTNFDSLHNYIIGIIGDARGPGSVQSTAEVELDCDYSLRYEYVIRCITAVSGYIDAQGNVVKLVEKLKFTPPKEGAG